MHDILKKMISSSDVVQYLTELRNTLPVTQTGQKRDILLKLCHDASGNASLEGYESNAIDNLIIELYANGQISLNDAREITAEWAIHMLTQKRG